MKKEALERKRSVLYLISSYLKEHNLHATLECLTNEAQLSTDVEVCDNIDLDTILQEYQSYYCAKFNKAPKITKTVKHPVKLLPQSNNNKETTASVNKRRSSLTVPSSATVKTPQQQQIQPETVVNDFQFEIRRLLCNGETIVTSTSITENQNVPSKSLCDFEGYSCEWREIADVILKEIVPNNLGVTWDDCVGLQTSVELLKESVIYPSIYPELFSGLITPWKGVLLYGPPGTGKTLLSRAVACEGKTTFFNVTSSCFVNKWRGESEKMIKVLFDVARFYAPSTIFIDELDALACGHSDYQHDASRRFKSELLTQLDGILREDDKVFVLATTNKPWDLDAAILRRFEKRILVDSPNEKTRKEIFRYYFFKNRNHFSDADLVTMSKISLDFSGSDIRIACKEACMRKLREVVQKIGSRQIVVENLKLEGPSLEDVIEAIESIRPVTNSRLQGKYLKWHDEFGCH